MSEHPNILLLGDEKIGPLIEERLGGVEVRRLDDPYDLLRALRQDKYSAVVLTAPRPELAQLCRAARQLHSNRVVAVCGVSGEAELRQLPPGLIDDYVVLPAGSEDLVRACGLEAGHGAYVNDSQDKGAQLGGRTAIEVPAAEMTVAPGDVADLLSAGTSIAMLEAALARMVAQRLSVQVHWVAQQTMSENDLSLLAVDGSAPVNGSNVSFANTAPPEPARAMVAEDPAFRPAPRQSQFLGEISKCLPALAANARRIESLHRLAVTDHLTGVYNRRYFYHVTDNILKHAAQRKFRATLLLFDIDNFKHYNETYGHAAGDEILREIAMLMRRISRTQDVVARIGGDEFAVLFWDEQPRQADSQPLESAFALADRFRSAVGNHSFPSLGPEAKGALSISGGLASFSAGGTNCRDLLRTADKGLREVKQTGKNAIRLIGPE